MFEYLRRFRATSDIDMILVMEDGGEEFCKVFWDYIVSGKYTCGVKKDEPQYYRFTNPAPGYPEQIELFSKRADFKIDSRIIPVYISEDVSSLSAIALDNDFYNFMKTGRKTIEGISVLGAEHIIPFKMYAWLNNMSMREQGIHVNTDDIKKHKNDVFRLFPLINPDEKIMTTGNVKETILNFIEKMKNENVADEFLYGRTKGTILEMIRDIYL